MISIPVDTGNMEPNYSTLDVSLATKGLEDKSADSAKLKLRKLTKSCSHFSQISPIALKVVNETMVKNGYSAGNYSSQNGGRIQ
jgi:hypothetical protein